MCGCPYGWAAPTCFLASASLPYCDPLNATQLPPACTFCDPNQPVGRQGCYNGGTCYYETRIPGGMPPPGLPVCGCSYKYAAPTCYFNSTRQRLCDPLNPLDAPPACEFCYVNAPVGQNGCLNQGFCAITPVTTGGAPPNYQITLCQCQQGAFVPPQCLVDTFTYFGRSDLIVYRWALFAGEVLVIVLSLLVLAQHAYYAYEYKFTDTNKTKAAGVFMVFMSALCGAMFYGVNPGGLGYGFPSKYAVTQTTLLVYSTVQFIILAIAISTSNWIWIGLAALSTDRRQRGNWPVSSKLITWGTVVILTVLNIFFACYQVVENNYAVFLYICSGFGIVFCIFSVVSGAVVMATIKSIESSDPKLLFRTASQLVLLCFGELVGSVLLVVVLALPSSVYVDGMTLFGIQFIFTALVLYMLQVLLLLQFRIAVWQLKEMALPRPNSIATSSASSARKTANSYTDSMSKGLSANSADGEIAEAKKKSDSANVEMGVIQL